MDPNESPVDESETFPGDPPEDFEPQPDLGPDQEGGLAERAPDLIAEAEAENVDDQSTEDGEADDDDDTDPGDD